MIGFYLALFVLPAAIIALSVILARHARLRVRSPEQTPRNPENRPGG